MAVLVFCVATGSALVADDGAASRGGADRFEVGELVPELRRSPALPAVDGSAGPQRVWRTVLRQAGASYVAPHFAHFELPGDAFVVLRDGTGRRRHVERADRGSGIAGAGFWSAPVLGETAIVELWSTGAALAAGALRIDRVARGFPRQEVIEPAASGAAGAKALCGADDSRWARCYAESEPTVYARSRAVARLLVNGRSACTGFLVGSEGHMLTNAHCVEDEGEAANTSVELMAEGECGAGCESYGACRGALVATTTRLVKVNEELDYALLELPTNAAAEYGYLQLRASGPVLGERIYLPQHPNFWGKKIAVGSGASRDFGGHCRVASLTERPCKGGPGDVGYMADTGGGSSGAPVLAYDDHLVVALHHCAKCPNRGVPMAAIVADLGPLLPRDALPGGHDAPPAASFVVAAEGLAASFTDTSSDAEGAIASWRWTFGDGTGSDERHPRHAYALAGSYTVTLTVVDAAGGTGTVSRVLDLEQPPAGLGNGDAVDGLWGGPGSERRFILDLPAGATDLVVETAGGTGDVDLYLRPGTAATLALHACRPFHRGNAELCAIPAPAAGRWHVLLHGYAGYTGVSLTAAWTVTEDGGHGGDGEACEGCKPHRGRLRRPGAAQWQPRPARSYRAGAGVHRARLAVPAGADFDLELHRRVPGRWKKVAETSGDDDAVSWSGPAGRYRWRVVGREGAGRYTLWLQLP